MGVCADEMQHVFADRAALLVARNAWCADKRAAAATYGDIDTWDISRVTDLSYLFNSPRGHACRTFNDKIGGWDTSRVTTFEVRLHAHRSPSPSPCPAASSLASHFGLPCT